ncbi:MAG: hypothetical protein ACOC1J_02740, partial [Prolixibacteraceae bacterium]
MNVEIPGNTKALVYLPKHNKSNPDIYEGDYQLVSNGEAQDLPDEFKFVRSTNDHVVLEVGSGIYEFKIRH